MTTETELRDRKFFDNMTKDQLVNECYPLNTLLVQMKEETQHLRQLNNKMIDSLVTKTTEQQDRKTKQIDEQMGKVSPQYYRKEFYPKQIPRNVTNLILSDSTFKKVQSSDISKNTAVHSYPSAHIEDISNVVNNYHPGKKVETLIIHAGHNNIDSGETGKKAADTLMESAASIIRKLSPLKVAICKLPPVKDGFFGRSKNNASIDIFNDEIETMVVELSGMFNIDVSYINNTLETKDIAYDGVHPSLTGGLQKMVRNIRNFYVNNNIICAETEIKPRIRRFPAQPFINFNKIDTNNRYTHNMNGK